MKYLEMMTGTQLATPKSCTTLGKPHFAQSFTSSYFYCIFDLICPFYPINYHLHVRIYNN